MQHNFFFFELSAKNTKIGRKSKKTVQKQDRNAIKIHELKLIQTVENYLEKARFISAKFLHTGLGFLRENCLLAHSFTLNFLSIFGKFLRNCSEMLKSTCVYNVTYIVNYSHFTPISLRSLQARPHH